MYSTRGVHVFRVLFVTAKRSPPPSLQLQAPFSRTRGPQQGGCCTRNACLPSSPHPSSDSHQAPLSMLFLPCLARSIVPLRVADICLTVVLCSNVTRATDDALQSSLDRARAQRHQPGGSKGRPAFGRNRVCPTRWAETTRMQPSGSLLHWLCDNEMRASLDLDVLR